MPQLFRLLCVCLGVTIMVAAQMHGVINNQHRVEHGVQFPGVSYEDMTATAHDHHGGAEIDDHAGHADATAVDVADHAEATAVDVAGDADDSPLSHHHHSGGDIHLALTSPAHPAEPGLLAAVDLGPAPHDLPSGLTGDGLSRPPRHARLIA